MTQFRKLYIAGVIAFLASPVSRAIKASPDPFEYTLEDGTTVMLTLHGDEYAHYYTDATGCILTEVADGQLHYATLGTDGTLVPMADLYHPLAAAPWQDYEALMRAFSNSEERGRIQQRKVAPESSRLSFPTKGSPHVAVILVEFSDNSFTIDDPQGTYDRMFNSPGFNEYSATGSVIDYYTENSDGQFTPVFDIMGPVKLANNIAYYGGNNSSGNDQRPAQMVIDACLLLDDEVDFSIYDTDDDGWIDNIYVFYAGYGEADGGGANTIWPHSWNVYWGAGLECELDGKRLDHYATSQELSKGSNTLTGIGTFCHEFGHVLSLPDLYATNYSGAFTPGSFSLMDSGSYNNNSRTPPLHSAYERYCLGWIEPEELVEQQNVTLLPTSDPEGINDARLISTDVDNEYYVLENRQRSGWDRYLPGHGMLIWHIDYDAKQWNSNTVNNDKSKQYVDLVEADGKATSTSRGGDPFPGTANVTSFTDDTTPSMRPWSGVMLYKPITAIQESSDGVITFLFDGGDNIFDPIVVEAPSAEAGTLTPGECTLRWNAVDGATAYVVNIYSRDDNNQPVYHADYYKKDVGDVTEIYVEDLTPSCTYYCQVRATNGVNSSSPSDEVFFTMLPPTLKYLQPENLRFSDIEETSFTVAWDPVEQAQSYRVTLYPIVLGDPWIELVDFTDGELPNGWTLSGGQITSVDSDKSANPPLLKMTTSGNTLVSPTYPAKVRSLSFWSRASLDNNSLYLTVYGREDEQWTELQKVYPTTTGAITQVHIPLRGMDAIKITFTRSRVASNIVIDDINLGWGGDYLTLDEGTTVDTNGATSWQFSDLSADQLYGVVVEAYNDDYTSKATDLTPVVESSSNSVKTALTDNANNIRLEGCRVVAYGINGTLFIHNIQGSQVGCYPTKGGKAESEELLPGVYIAKFGTSCKKIMIN